MGHRLVTGFVTAISCWVMLGLGTGTALAQELRELRGSVRDEAGGALPGVLVEITDGVRTVRATTDESGQYQLTGLMPGRYRLQVTAEGFAPFTIEVDLEKPRRSPLVVELRVLIDERVEVMAPSAPGASGGFGSTLIMGEALRALPGDSSRMVRSLSEMAGATGRSGEVTVTVDGFRRVVRLPPREMIQMIRISSNPFAPEFAEPGRIRIEIVTKPGSKDFHGEFKSDYNDAWLSARNAFASEEGPMQTRNFSGYLAGPVVPGRWSFTAYAGRWTEHGSGVVNARIVDTRTYLPVSVVQNVSTPRTIDSVWLGSDLQVAPQHTLAVSYNRNGDHADNLGLSGGLNLPERAYSRSVRENALRLSLVSFFGTRLLHESRVEYGWNTQLAQAHSSAPALLVFDAFNGGGNEQPRFSDSRDGRVQLTDHVTLTYGRSTIKAGIQADTARRRYDDRSGFGGTFVFGADVERDNIGSPVRSATGETTPITPLESYRRTLLGTPGYAPSQFSIVRGNPIVTFSQWWLGWFIQQDWPVSPRFSVSYGLRQDLQTYASGLRDLGPRIGVGWKADKAGKGTVRAGVGLFTSRIDTNLTLDIRRLDGIRQRTFVVAQPNFFPTVPDALTGSDGSQLVVYRKADDLRAPRTSMAMLSYDRELRQGVAASAVYSFERGVGLTRLINANVPVLGSDGLRRPPTGGPVMQYESTGRSAQHELVVGVRSNVKGVNLAGNYTVARTRSDTDGPSTTPADSSQLAAEYGAADADQRHAASLSFSRSLPGGVYASVAFTLSSGRPFNITTGRDNNGDSLFTDRPAFAKAGDAGAIVTSYGVFDPDPAPGAQIVPRNFGRSPGLARTDLYFAKSMKAGPKDQTNITIGASVDNVFNRVNLAGFNGVLSSPAFGLANYALPPRRVELTVSVTF